jgi:hypothetical protein
VHVILALADHFEPAIDPKDGQSWVPRSEQERRWEWWTRDYLSRQSDRVLFQ